MRCLNTRFVCIRYGNVLASSGSVIPLFLSQIQSGGPVTVTTEKMTRFLLSLDDAVDTVIAAVKDALPGETYVPRAPSALVLNVAKALIEDRNVKIEVIGIRPGEKTHEIMVSDVEAPLAVQRGRWFGILSMLPEVRGDQEWVPALEGEYSSGQEILSLAETASLLKEKRLMLGDQLANGTELLR